MFTTRTSPSIRLMVLVMLCVLGLCGIGWADNPPAVAKTAKPSGKASMRIDPALQVKLTVDFKAPKAQDIVDRLRAETKMDLTLADNIDRERPALGSLSCRNVPAFIIMDELAKSPIIQGKWERNGEGYRLTSPLPPPVLATASPTEPPPLAGPANLGWRYFLFALPVLALLGILLVVRYRRRSQPALATSVKPDAPKSASSS